MADLSESRISRFCLSWAGVRGVSAGLSIGLFLALSHPAFAQTQPGVTIGTTQSDPASSGVAQVDTPATATDADADADASGQDGQGSAATSQVSPPPAMVAPVAGSGPVLTPYQVTGVPIDATAENAAKAREKAIAAGQVEALQKLLHRLVAPSDYARLPSPSASDVEQMVLGLSIRDEKTSAVRYLAKIDVSFMPKAVQTLLSTAGLSYVQGTSRPMLVLPIWQAGPDSTPTLWEEPNPWRDAWSSRTSGGLVSTEVPMGDLTDLSMVDVARAEALDEQALAAITQRYGADGAMVVEATATPASATPENGASAAATGQGSDAASQISALSIRVRQTALRGVPPLTVSVAPAPGEPMDAFLSRAVEETAQAMDGAWKQQALTYAGPVSDAVVTAHFDSLKDWLIIREGLSRVPAVRRWSLNQLQLHTAQVTLGYGGSFDDLGQALSAEGVLLALGDQGWELRRGVEADPTASPSSAAPVASPMTSPATSAGASDGSTATGRAMSEDPTAGTSQTTTPQQDLPQTQGTITVQ